MSQKLNHEINPGPRALPHAAELKDRLSQALKAKTSDYVPRTRHISSHGTPTYTNALLLEASPYLQQHAHNPVSWYPWCEDAFRLARELNRPVLLSVGYATCHWCHVMEEESFEDEEIAAYINAHFIAIKVDREERPDIDNVYMACVQAWSGHGGWPMTVVLTPERKPFFGGTYFPPRAGARGARFGFIELLQDLRRVYDEDPERVALAASNIIEHIKEKHELNVSDSPMDREYMLGRIKDAYKYYARLFDRNWGGLSGAPKFPSSLPLRFLLRYANLFGEEAASLAHQTLNQIAAGGIHDHLGGGFHRYSVDEMWLVPHFEKMLYDNALLSIAYVEGWQYFKDPDLAVTACSTLDYVRREMMRQDGGFYAAQDADSPNPERHGEREEGVYFTWTLDEFNAVLGETKGSLMAAYLGVRSGGNFEGRSVLHQWQSLEEFAAEKGISSTELESIVKDAKVKLLQHRSERQAPLTDDKVVTAWHALMVSAFAKAYVAFGRSDDLRVAQNAMNFVRSKLWVDGRLVRCFKDGPSRTLGFFDDYAFVIQALLDLHEADFDSDGLAWAIDLTEDCEQLFAAAGGGYYLTSHDAEALLIRERPQYDGAIPAATSVHALNLLRLSQLCDHPRYKQRAEGIFAAVRPTMDRSPAMLSEMLLAMDFALSDVKQILMLTDDRQKLKPFYAALGHSFGPHRVVTGADRHHIDRMRALVPGFKDKIVEPGKVTVFLCQGQKCQLPVHDAEAFKLQLK